MSPLQFAHATPNSAGIRSAWKRSRRQRRKRKNITPTSITLWLARVGAGAQGVRPACLVLHPQNAGANGCGLCWSRKEKSRRPCSRISGNPFSRNPIPMTPACPVVKYLSSPWRRHINNSLKMINKPHVFITTAKRSRNLPRIHISSFIQRSCCRSIPSNVKTLRKMKSLETTNSPAGSPQSRYLSHFHHRVLGTQSAAALQHGGDRSEQILEGKRNLRTTNHPFAQ